jgi:acyl carrier protein
MDRSHPVGSDGHAFSFPKSDSPRREGAGLAGLRLVSADELTPDTCLFSSGILDSLAFAELVFFVERDLDVSLGDHANATMSSMDRFGDAVRLIADASRA